MPSRQPKLLDQIRATLHRKYYFNQTEKSYLAWIRRFILFHSKQDARMWICAVDLKPIIKVGDKIGIAKI